MLRGMTAERLVALFLLAWALLNFPLLALWDQSAFLWGFPIFPSALFGIWAVLIVGLAWLMERYE